ncbi:hypothetical protein LTR08_001079 [Meristemomyces frigidus]|nr:hypothetical protein LTR08_001079 [Meristemomyces frigidus]
MIDALAARDPFSDSNTSEHSPATGHPPCTATHANAEDDHVGSSISSAEALLPYELRVERHASTYDARMLAPSMLDAIPVRIKAKWLVRREVGIFDSLLRYEELMFLGPHTTIDEFLQSFAEKAAGHRHPDTFHSPMSAGDRMRMRVQATWQVRRFLRTKKKVVDLTVQNWPEVTGGLAFGMFEGLTVYYWIEKRETAHNELQ